MDGKWTRERTPVQVEDGANKQELERALQPSLSASLFALAKRSSTWIERAKATHKPRSCFPHFPRKHRAEIIILPQCKPVSHAASYCRGHAMIAVLFCSPRKLPSQQRQTCQLTSELCFQQTGETMTRDATQTSKTSVFEQL